MSQDPMNRVRVVQPSEPIQDNPPGYPPKNLRVVAHESTQENPHRDTPHQDEASVVVHRPHDPTGTDVAERIASAARGVAPVKRRKSRTQADPVDAVWSGPGPSSRDPQRAGTILDAVLTKRGWKKQVSVSALMPRWAEFVGSVNAEHTKPEKWESGVLTIRTESTTWATSMRAMAPQIIAKLNEILGQKTVTKLNILGPQAPSWKKGLRSVPGRGPRDTYG